MFKKRTENKSTEVWPGSNLHRNVPLRSSAFKSTRRPLSEDYTDEERAVIEEAQEMVKAAGRRFAAEFDRQTKDGRVMLEKTAELVDSQAEVKEAKSYLSNLERAAQDAVRRRRRTA